MFSRKLKQYFRDFQFFRDNFLYLLFCIYSWNNPGNDVTYTANADDLDSSSTSTDEDSKDTTFRNKSLFCNLLRTIDEINGSGKDLYQKMGCSEFLGRDHPMGKGLEKEIEKTSLETLFHRLKLSNPGCGNFLDSLKELAHIILEQEHQIESQKKKQSCSEIFMEYVEKCIRRRTLEKDAKYFF